MMDPELAKEIDAYKSWKDKFGGFSRDMTLRDYFAAKVMQSLLAGLESGKEAQAALIPAVVIPAVAYQLADAMLEARET